MVNNKKLHEILAAGALGDSFGYQVEFDNCDQINHKFSGPISYYKNPGKIASDDTQMTIFMLNSLLESESLCLLNNPDYLNNIEINLLDWYYTQINQKIDSDLNKYTVLFVRRAPGNTCMRSLMLKDNREDNTNNSNGCGTIMRTAPLIALKISDQQLYDLSISAAAITHGDPLGQQACAFYAVLLKNLAQSHSFDESWKNALNIAASSQALPELLARLDQVLTLPNNLSGDQLTSILGEGWDSASCLYLAIYAFKNSSTFAATLELATNHAGDSDSVASIAGQLFAAHHNLSETDWQNYQNIDLAPVIDSLIVKLRLKNGHSSSHALVCR